jgi:hypothetical protein
MSARRILEKRLRRCFVVNCRQGESIFSKSRQNADDDMLLNLFDIVVFTFAYTAHGDKRAKEFIQRSIGIEQTHSSIFHRLFSRIFR